jgi:phospholipase C
MMNKLDTFKNVVVLMLENRSFDNLLGYLYEDGVPEGKIFEGLQGKSISNPVPTRVGGLISFSTVNAHIFAL